MKVLALLGSPRKNGRTHDALDYFITALKDAQVETIIPGECHILPCTGCEACAARQGHCILEDDMTAIYPKMAQCDLLVVASPVYFSAFPSPLKALIDRCQLFYNRREKGDIPPKAMVLIALGGAPAYPDQFTGLTGTLRWVAADLKATVAGTVTIPNTDRGVDGADLEEKLKDLARKAVEEVAQLKNYPKKPVETVDDFFEN